MSETSRFTIRPRGPFSLEEAAKFGFGQRIDPTWDRVMRLAFCVDGYLIVVRGSGFADVAVTEPKAMEFAAKLYRLPRPPTEDEFRAMANGWRPFRTWAIVLMRAAGSRVSGRPVGASPPASAALRR